MKTFLEYVTFGALSFLLTMIFIPVLKKLALKINLVDIPNSRKVHENPVPLVGGIAIALTAFILIFIFAFRVSFPVEYLPILGCSLVLLIVGVIDDKYDVDAKNKLLIQMMTTFIMALSGIRITSLYGLFNIYEIAIWAQYLLTIIAITGVVNAFNLMDGVDGLVGSLSILGFSMFLLVSIYCQDYFLSLISVVFIGALIGFLKFNLSKKKIFMGDSGSLFLGFILVGLGIRLIEKQLTSKEYNYAYVFLLVAVFFSIPVLDSMRVYMGRIKRGNSPFNADKSHLHHLLLRVGLTHKKIALAVVLLSMVLFFVGFGLATFFSITVILLAIMTVFWIVIRFLLLVNHLKEWAGIVKEMEQSS